MDCSDARMIYTQVRQGCHIQNELPGDKAAIAVMVSYPLPTFLEQHMAPLVVY